ncbi:MAG: hypothetical protein AAF997_13105 [Myxococcota bacterium]
MDDNSRELPRNATTITWICALAPLGLLLLAAVIATEVRSGLGYWPQSISESYESPLATVAWWSLYTWLLFTLFGAPVVWLAGVTVGWLASHRWRMFALQPVAYAAAWALVLGVCAWNPLGFPEWLMD